MGNGLSMDWALLVTHYFADCKNDRRAVAISLSGIVGELDCNGSPGLLVFKFAGYPRRFRIVLSFPPKTTCMYYHL